MAHKRVGVMVIGQIICADVMDGLAQIDSKSIDVCVTSPPYFGLRDYGAAGQIGLEQSPESYVEKMVSVFREVRRVLRDDGTLWLNLGDSYGKDKNLLGIPWRVAFALQADGWCLRSDIIWNKPNAMPESIRDRPTRAHEYVFLLTKSRRYYYDYEAIKEPLAPSSIVRLSQDIESQHGSERANGGTRADRPMKAVFSQVGGSSGAFGPEQSRKRSGNKARKYDAERGRPADHLGGSVPWEGVNRNKRSVWTVATKAYKGAHFATFPADLIRPCILAGSREGGIVLDPFFGSGTTGVVSLETGRDYIGIEINPEYVALAKDRISKVSVQLEF